MDRHCFTTTEISSMENNFAGTRKVINGKLSRAVRRTPRYNYHYPAVGLSHSKRRQPCPYCTHMMGCLSCVPRVAINLMYIAE